MATEFACQRVVEEDDLTCPCDLEDFTQLEIDAILDAASDMLALISDAPVGRCTEAFRPCRETEWCYSPCQACGLIGIHLPGMKPEVTQVRIDGSVVATSLYTTLITPIGHYVLERMDANGRALSWPASQNLRLPGTADNTFEITVESGPEVTPVMRLAAGQLACDMFSALSGEDHVLPDGVVSATMNGLTVDFRRFSDPTDQTTMALAGLNWVQRYLTTMPSNYTTQILAPEISDGWALYRRAA